MARNSEKAQSMLFRFRAAQAAESGVISTSLQRRPKAPSTIESISICEKWRGQVLKEVSRKVTRIQDEALSDFQIRDLNDEINKLMKEKWGWERRIRELGGPNYMRGGGTVLDAEGREAQMSIKVFAISLLANVAQVATLTTTLHKGLGLGSAQCGQST